MAPTTADPPMRRRSGTARTPYPLIAPAAIAPAGLPIRPAAGALHRTAGPGAVPYGAAIAAPSGDETSGDETSGDETERGTKR
ncbi:hypothetical protein GCM10010466_47560 [Planomonospora alba]|uniref:Uncharacterized protein n=1 Tax=Planomonospora alba TaxID=161354 RepID=A0ABP6NJV1_9ACTN